MYLVEGQDTPKSPFSNTKVDFQCQCGNTFKTRWKSYANGQSKSCGKCKIYIWRKSEVKNFSMLSLITDPEAVKRLTDKVWWTCSCGEKKEIKLINVLNGSVKSCGCIKKQAAREARSRQIERGMKTAEEWKKEIPEMLEDQELPLEWSSGTSRKIWFSCKCGRTFTRKFSRYSRETATCGSCTERFFRTGEKIGNLTYVGTDRMMKEDTVQMEEFLCECGGRFRAKVRNVVKGLKKSCGWCDATSKSDMEKRTFGKLKMKIPERAYRYSDKVVTWECSCGGQKDVAVGSVIRGLTLSCGSCRVPAMRWHEENRETIRKTKCPIQPGLFLGGLMILEPVPTVDYPFMAECMVCGKAHRTRFHDIRVGESLTCGCSSGFISSGQSAIADEIRKMGLETALEHQAFGNRYDVFVPAANLLIEFNGLKWHSYPDSRDRDFRKYREAILEGSDYIMIYEDEWREKRERVMSLIRNRVGRSDKTRGMRPGTCEMRAIGSEEADSLLKDHHYIGACRAKTNYGAFLGGRLVACASFKRPTRQSKHDWELVRMASVPDIRVHGVWSKLLSLFVREHSPKSIVSFSDNRLFSGKVYEKIGFKYYGEVAPDYYWVRSKKRHHKSALRKKKEEKSSGLTEAVLRESQGYKKIWDLGKKRWVFKGV